MKRAQRIQIFDKDGNELTNYKAIANEQDQQEIFSIVKNGYRIIQHDEVFQTIQDAIADKNLNATVKPHPDFDGNGGRVHIEATFPDINVDVENNGIQAQLHCTYDNSYDGTTGLRLRVGAKMGKTVLWVMGAKYYHKHTKSVSVIEFEKQLELGIKLFQEQIKKDFKAMLKTPVSQASAEDFLIAATELKGVRKKYIEEIQSQVKQSTITNKWQLYKIICDVLSKTASSIDVRDQQLTAIITKLHKTFKSDTSSKLVTPPESEGGAVKLTDAFKGKSEAVKEYAEANNIPVVELPLVKMIGGSIPALRVQRKAKRKFAVMQGDVEIKTFRRHKQAQRYANRAAA